MANPPNAAANDRIIETLVNANDARVQLISPNPVAGTWQTVATSDLNALQVVQKDTIRLFEDLPVYSIRNGELANVVPYLIAASIPERYHWVPINNMAPRDAIKCMDGFIRSYLFHLTVNAPLNEAGNAAAQALDIRKQAIILGVTRAVMTANYGLAEVDITPAECADPVLSARVAEDGTVSYVVLVPTTAAHRAHLVDPLALTFREEEVMKVLVRCAQTIPPLHGYNLMGDGHHYLSDPKKQSFKSFLAVERQVWNNQEWKTWTEGVLDEVRDVLWHKAGHPVATVIKEFCATSLPVKATLENIKLGSAAARLPAVESDVRAATTYVKLMSAVDAMWQMNGGYCDPGPIARRIEVVSKLPRNVAVVDPPAILDDGLEGVAPKEFRNRQDALVELMRVINLNSAIAATAFGFYEYMINDASGSTGTRIHDTLGMAHSLERLKTHDAANYVLGMQHYDNHKNAAARAREAGNVAAPRLTANF